MRTHPFAVLLLAAIVLGFATSSSPVFAQGLEYVKANYTKYEYHVPMRDGKRLFTSVYVPKDQSQKYPILMTRTPYSCKPYGVDQYRNDVGPNALFGKEGYIFVSQDVRGKWMSEGEFVNMRPHVPDKQNPTQVDESSDAYDTVDWLLKHIPGHNGKVGVWGVSYPGYYAACALIDAHPAIVCGSPQAPINDWFVGDDWHHNGAVILPHLFNFMSKHGQTRPEPTKKIDHAFEYGTPDGYDFYLKLGPLANANTKHLQGKVEFWNDVMQHGTYDEFWKSRDIRPHLKNIRPAVLTVGGWFDAENLFGALETYQRIETTSPQSSNTLVMGPWKHGQWNSDAGLALGHVQFNAKTGDYYREQIEFPFFQYHLKGKGEFKQPEAWVFETGTNQWRQEEKWPPSAAKSKALFLQANGQLSFAEPPGGAGAFDEYISYPARPVPYTDWTEVGMSPNYMVADQRFASRRPDVLVYQTEIIEQDLRLAGPIEVDLTVSTTGTDSDWIVKVIDVYPDDYPDPAENPMKVRLGGFQQLIRGDVMRGKFRNSFEKPEPFQPGEPTRVRFKLPDICHAFRPGHRLMIQIQSSWFPLVDRNPQTFVDIYSAKPEDFQKATQRLYRSGPQASKVVVRVVE